MKREQLVELEYLEILTFGKGHIFRNAFLVILSPLSTNSFNRALYSESVSSDVYSCVG